jgi:endogenous inhibitor of DNA gyrase (YacG/DUF329 family)
LSLSDKRRTPVVACPTCQAAVAWTPDSRWRPFCSQRCKLIDMGQWASESYRVAGEPDPLADEPATGHAQRDELL